MRNYWAICRKELHSLFVSPIAYVLLAVFFGVTGFFFALIADSIIEQVGVMAFQAQQFGQPPQPIDVPRLILNQYFGILSTVFLFLLPMVTMGVFAEERKRGTLELLFTSPVTHIQLVLGKFTGLLIFLGIMLAPSVITSCITQAAAVPSGSLPTVLATVLGVFLLGGALLSVGVFVSSLTENQIIAAVGTFGVFLILWVVDSSADPASTLVNETLRYISVLNHYEDFTRGIIDTQHVVFYASFIFLGLFLTSISLDSAKWRQ